MYLPSAITSGIVVNRTARSSTENKITTDAAAFGDLFPAKYAGRTEKTGNKKVKRSAMYILSASNS